MKYKIYKNIDYKCKKLYFHIVYRKIISEKYIVIKEFLIK